ncbi:MAG: hypothetical protein EBU59_12025, partial [Planctomycetia bacterium]|nr:hypothetical protein [Planctomycetia bacterium]
MVETPQQPLNPDDTLPPVEPPSVAFLVQLFLVPGLIVAIIVCVWLAFHWLAHLGNDPQAYVRTLRRANEGRWQAALNLANDLRGPGGSRLKSDTDLASELGSILDDEVASGRTGEQSQTLRLYLCRALGEFTVPEAAPALVRRVDANDDDLTTQAAIEAHPEFAKIQKETLKILQSNDRIPYFRRRGEYLYNFWQDAEHTRGIWRRTTWEEYKKDDPEWETVLDIDALAEEENANWVYKGVEVLEPSLDLAILRLSPGGKDASVYREFSIPEKKFVDGGFELKEAKSDLTWIDKDTTLVSTDYGEGTLTESGYPRIVKLWKRGQPLCEAKTLFEGETSDVGCWPFTIRNSEGTFGFIRRSKTFYKGHYYHINQENAKVYQLEIPEDARLSDLFGNQLLV